MAFSKSLQKGQIALCCQMCEETSEIKWKCLTCQFFMCTKCCKIHRKVKSSDNHDIVDIHDIAVHSSELETTPDFVHIKCIQHPDQTCCLYCKVCEEVVCPTCIAEVHNTHNMVEISEGYQLSLSKIKNMNSEVEGDILQFTTDASKLDSIRSTERSQYMMQREKILSHEKAVKDAIEKHTAKLLTNLDQRWTILDTSLEGEETNVIKTVKELETENQVLTRTMDSNNASEVFKIASERNRSKRQSPKPVNTKYQRLPRFVPGEINAILVESYHGTFEEVKEQSIVQKVQIQTKEQYTTTIPKVSSLVCCDDGSLWISCSKNGIIQKVKCSHGVAHVNKTINLKSFDMALTSNGDVLLSSLHNSLRFISHTTGEVKSSKFGVFPFKTTAVHVSSNKEIVVGTMEGGSVFSAKRQVLVMDMGGRLKSVYCYDKKKNPLFTYPFKITTDKDNSIYVVDTLSDHKIGRVVVLEQRGGTRGIHVYTGHPDINDTNRLFAPADIVTTQSGNAIVADRNNNALHILNNNAQCIQYLHTELSGIMWPSSMYYDQRGFLFIGCSSGKRDPDKAKIHVVQLV